MPAAKPAATPSTPPQLVACGGPAFYRITYKALQAFEVSAHIPPPQIRGSATARQTAEVEMVEPLNVTTFDGNGALVIAKRGVFRLKRGETQAQAAAPIPTSGPLVAWSDAQHRDSFWVHTQGERSLQQYEVTPLASADTGAPPKPHAPSRTRSLPEFDGRLFTVLANGAPWYSAPGGLSSDERSSEVVPLPKLSEPTTLLFADASASRYWATDALGSLQLYNRNKHESPVFTSRVPGVVIDTAVEGDRVAVLSMQLKGYDYQPTVTIFAKGKQQGQLSIGPTIARHGQPELDVCLIAGRPWVVVGGRHWLHLLDWSTPRLLAEW